MGRVLYFVIKIELGSPNLIYSIYYSLFESKDNNNNGHLYSYTIYIDSYAITYYWIVVIDENILQELVSSYTYISRK